MTDNLPSVTMAGALCPALRPQLLHKCLVLTAESQVGIGNFPNNDTWVLAFMSLSH